MTDQNPLLERLAAGEALSCHWMDLGSAGVAEVMSEARPDVMIFDMQHGLWDPQNLFDGFAAIRGKSEPVVRVADQQSRRSSARPWIWGPPASSCRWWRPRRRPRPLVAAAKYRRRDAARPAGHAPDAGFHAAMPPTANRHAFCVGVMIETALGLKNAAAIAAVPGVDLVFIGPGDLSISMGEFPDPARNRSRHPDDPRRLPQGQDALRPVHLSMPASRVERMRQGFQLVLWATTRISCCRPRRPMPPGLPAAAARLRSRARWHWSAAPIAASARPR